MLRCSSPIFLFCFAAAFWAAPPPLEHGTASSRSRQSSAPSVAVCCANPEECCVASASPRCRDFDEDFCTNTIIITSSLPLTSSSGHRHHCHPCRRFVRTFTLKIIKNYESFDEILQVSGNSSSGSSNTRLRLQEHTIKYKLYHGDIKQ